MNLTYSVKQIIILREKLINIILGLSLVIPLPASDVNDIIVRTDGNAIICYVTSIGHDSLTYRQEKIKFESVLPLDEVYYVYNDFGKILYYSRSLHERLNHIEQYSGLLLTTAGDSIAYKEIYFDGRMTKPRAYLTIDDTSQAVPVPFLDISSVRMSAEHFKVSVRRGCLSGATLLVGFAGLKTFGYFTDEYNGEGLFTGASVKALLAGATSSVNDFLPASAALGTDATGTGYRLATSIFPLFTVGWIGYDWYFDKRTIYINPISTESPFPQDMFLFSAKEWGYKKYRKIWTPVSRAVLEQTYKIRRAIWKG